MLTEEIKTKIDNMNYQEMLRLVRFAPLGDPMFQGKIGDYFGEVMSAKRKEIGPGACVAASKAIGWKE